MARAKKEASLTPEERLQAALVPDWEWPYKLPENWCWTYFKSISTIQTGKKDANYGSDEGKYPFFTCAAEPIRCHGYSFDCRAILLAGNGDINNISRYNGKFEAYQRTYVVKIAEPLCFDYIFYWFKYRWFDFNKGKMFGTAIPYIRLGNLQEFPTPIPPLAEQQRIVDRIESLFAKLDEAKEKAQAVVDSFETRKAAILHKAFTGELTAKWREEHNISKTTWGEKKWGDFLQSIEAGKNWSAEGRPPEGTEFGVVKVSAVTWGEFDELESKTCVVAEQWNSKTQIHKVFLEKMRPDTFLVLAGDTYQIESIDFGNWFTYAKDIIKTKGSNVELVSTWRTKDPGLIELWNETRNKGALITEKLVIDGPFSENIGEGVLNSEIMDEVILCLNYDGKFGLNNMNSYFQNANTETAVVWRDWKYKVGDHILFNDTDRFSLLYNNLKGQIVQIELFDSRIRFTVDVEIPLTEQDCQNDGIEFIDIIDDVTRIRFDVLDFEEEMADEDRKKAIVPFQLAYAVSIHKAQGLEYRSVKVVIPSSNAEKITHGIFYTAITRAKEKLKIYWSSETMQEVVAGFSVDTSRQKSLAIIKEKLKQDKNT